MNSKVGIFSVLFATMMMLLIPITSMVNAQQYDRYYEDRYYEDENAYEEYYYPTKDKKEQKPPMLLVKKDVLYCDVIANGSRAICLTEEGLPGPNSGRYVQECIDEQCEEISDSSFEIKVENANIFEGDKDGTKLTYNGERFTVTEENSNAVETFLVGEFAGPQTSLVLEQFCQESGFDSSYVFGITGQGILPVLSCVDFEGECSGIVQDGELKECTVKNYVVWIGLEI